MARLPFRSNYYRLLGLEPEVKPVNGSPEIEAAIRAVKDRLASGGGASPEDKVAAELANGLLAQMKRDLAEDGAPVWADHQKQWKKERKKLDKRRAGVLSSTLEVLGESAVPEVSVKKLKAEIGDDRLVDKALSKARITVLDKPDDAGAAPKLRASARKANAALAVLGPMMRLEGAEDLWELLSNVSGATVAKGDPPPVVKASVEALVAANKDRNLSREAKAAYLRLRNAIDPLMSDYDPKDADCALMVFDDLWRLEAAFGLATLLSVLATMERVYAEQFERAAARASRAAGLPVERVKAIILGMFEARRIQPPKLSASAVKALRVCAFCGELHPSDLDACSSCGKSPFTKCLICHERVDGSVGVCASCGVATDVAAKANRHLQTADLRIANGEFGAAMSALDEAMKIAPALNLTDRRADIETRRKAADEALIKVNRLVAARKFVAAEAQLERLSGVAAQGELSKLASKVAQAMSDAKKISGQAAQKIEVGEIRDAVALVRKAQSIVADDAEAAALLDRIPPDPPTGIKVAPRKTSMQISWTPAADAGADVSYAISRAETLGGGGVGPMTEIANVKATSYRDQSCPGGAPVVYSVLAQRPKARAMRALTSRPATLLRPVEGLSISPVKGEIALSWRLPDGAETAEIRRYRPETPLAKRQSAPPVGSGSESWTDRDGGVTGFWVYAVTACYPDRIGGGVLRAPPVACDVEVQSPPSLIRDFAMSDDQNFLAWAKSAAGDEVDAVHFFGSTASLPEEGAIAPISALPRAAVVSPRNGEARIVRRDFPPGDNQAVVVRTKGGLARFSGAIKAEKAPALADVRAFQDGAEAVVTWRWPADVERARIKMIVHASGRDVERRFNVDAVGPVGECRKAPAVSSKITFAVESVTRSGATGPPVESVVVFTRPTRISAGLRVEKRLRGLLSKQIFLDFRSQRPLDWPEVELRARFEGGASDPKAPVEERTLPRIPSEGRSGANARAVDLSGELAGKKGKLMLKVVGAAAAEGIAVRPSTLAFDFS